MFRCRGGWLPLAAMIGASFAGGASAADLFRHPRHHAVRSAHRLATFTGDAACPQFEPSVYRPRIANPGEPLCYAARPYGLSQHLYDISGDIMIRRGD